MLTLHVGLPKTATTFLQYRIFARQDKLAYIHDPGDKHGVERLLRTYQRATEGDLTALEGRIAAALPPGESLVSNENISIQPRETWDGSGPSPGKVAERLERLVGVVGQLQVLIGIRRQDQWLASRYAESAKQAPEFGQDDFEARMASLCDAPLEGSLGWLDYHDVHTAFADRLGDESVLLVPSEALSEDPETALARLERFLPCPGLVSIYRAQAGENLRRNVLSEGHNRWRLRNRDETLELPAELGHRIVDRFAASNHRAARVAGVNLATYAYC